MSSSCRIAGSRAPRSSPASRVEPAIAAGLGIERQPFREAGKLREPEAGSAPRMARPDLALGAPDLADPPPALAPRRDDFPHGGRSAARRPRDQAGEDDQQGEGKIGGPGAARGGAPGEPRLSDRAA